MKERVTLTLDLPLIARIDSRVDGQIMKNRSHAVELLLREAQAVILAGGSGSLEGMKKGIPLSMAHVNGRPILQHNIDLLRKYGIKEIILCVAYRKDEIKSYFGDGKRMGVTISYVEEDRPTGTASILRKARDLIKGTFLLTNGDDLKDVDIEDMFDFHSRTKAFGTIALTTVDDPSPYGVVKLKGNRVLEFTEKPVSSKVHLINSGLYIFEQPLLDFINKRDASLVRDVLPGVASKYQLNGYLFDGQWIDTSTDAGYSLAQKNWKGIE